MRAVDLKRVMEGRRGTLVAVGLALATVAAYWQVRSFDFTGYDDPPMLVDNPIVGSGLTLHGILWAFSTSWHEYWHPVTWLSHMLDYELFGVRPGWHHLVSVGFHVANTVLLFEVLRRMTGALWRSAMVAALFALHPLHVESVAWLAERKDVLSAFFFMLTLWAYVRYAEGRMPKAEGRREDSEANRQPSTPRNTQLVLRFYILALLFFALGLMSKPMLVTLPFVLLLLDYWPLRRLEFRTGNLEFKALLPLLREKLPFFALTLASCAITYIWALRSGHTFSADKEPWGLRLGNVPVAYVRYLGKMIWPADLAVAYPMPSHLPWWGVWGAVLVLVLATVWVVGRARQAPYGIVGWLIFVGMLVPTIRLVQAAHHPIADRYTYLPSIGLFVGLVFGANAVGTRMGMGVAVRGTIAGLTLAACLVMTTLQVRHWRNSETLFRHALDVTQNNAVAHYNLGVTLGGKGQIDEAIRQYEQTIRLKPDYADAHDNLGLALLEKGQMDEAIWQFQEALRLRPDHANAHNNLAMALGRKGQIDEAIRQLQEALRLRPDHADARNNLGNALLEKGQTDQAITEYQETIRLKPAYAEAHNNLGAALGKKGQLDEAIRQYREAIRLKPGYADAHNNLGNALLEKGQSGEAIRQYREVLRLKPDDADARKNLDSALATQAGSPKRPDAATKP